MLSDRKIQIEGVDPIAKENDIFLTKKEALAQGVFFIDSNPQTSKEKWLNYFKIGLLALPWIGVEAIWQAEFAVTVQYLQAMGLRNDVASYIWLSGPLMGLFVAPMVGMFSDKTHSRFGRRRPWLVLGFVLLTVFSLLLAFSKNMGSAGLGVAMASFILLDACINIIQTPLRSLIGDIAPSASQGTGQLIAVCLQGLGGLIARIFQYFFYTNDPLDITNLLISVLVLNAIVISVTCFFVKEEALKKKNIADENKTKAKCTEWLSHFWNYGLLKMLRGKFLIVFATVFFSWYALFNWFTTSNVYYTQIVTGGCCVNPADDPDTVCTEETYQLCQDGLEIDATVNIIANAMGLVLGFVLSILMNYNIIKRLRYLWAFSLFFGALLFILSKWVHAEAFAYILGAGIFIPRACINSIPFALIGKYNRDESASKDDLSIGVQFGILNMSIVIPQIICTLITGSLRDDFGLDWLLVVAGCSWVIAGITALFIIEK